MATVAKALRLLECFSPDRGEIGLSAFARAAGYDKATAHRHLTELARFGLVEQDGVSKVYRLGPALPRLAALREATQPRDLLARPAVERLSLETGETAHLSLFEGDRLVTAWVAQSPAHSTRVVLELGEELPVHATASGLAVLAALPRARRAAVLAGPLPQITAATETDPAALAAALVQVAQSGVAQSVGGYEADVHGTAMVLIGPGPEVSGAIAVAAPANRMTPAQSQTIRAALVRAQATILETWGARPPAPAPTIAEAAT